ncbi:MAG TPA: ABC transporter substrate-binding protein [Alphaproteobacteria bacterium]|nr:ABC transporter substrate-binding protein [Alphaproteobacteria bacterium]
MLAGPAMAQTFQPVKLTLILDWFVNPDHGPIIVAEERGYFADAGLKIEIVAPADPNDPPKLVAAGRADLAVSYQPQLIMQAAEGLPLVRVATLVDTPLNSLVVLRDGPIKSPADLRGRKIGFSVGGVEEALLTTMLGRHGLKLADVTLVNVNFSLSPALLAGQVDAVIGAFRNFELNQLAIAGRPGRAFYVEEEGVPTYDELVVVANRARARTPEIRRFVDAIERGVAYTINNPDAAWKLFIKGRANLDDEINRRAWKDTLIRFAHSPAALDRLRYERFARFLHERGLIARIPPLDDYAIEPR